ncbi:MAG: hypothetical protein WC378_15530 [Opitutaceae bacterium]|jgi:hypothetical protein
MKKTKNTRVSKTEISRRLECHRETVRRYLSEPGAPLPDKRGRYDFEAARGWLQSRAPRAAASPELRREQIRLMQVQTETLKLRLAVSKREYIPLSEYQRVIAPLMSELQMLMRQKFLDELPPQYIGRNADGIRALNEKSIDEIIERFRTGILPFKPAENQGAAKP